MPLIFCVHFDDSITIIIIIIISQPYKCMQSLTFWHLLNAWWCTKPTHPFTSVHWNLLWDISEKNNRCACTFVRTTVNLMLFRNLQKHIRGTLLNIRPMLLQCLRGNLQSCKPMCHPSHCLHCHQTPVYITIYERGHTKLYCIYINFNMSKNNKQAEWLPDWVLHLSKSAWI